MNRGEQVNFEIERERLFHLFEGRNVLNRRITLEKRIIESFGIALWIVENACKISVFFPDVLGQNGCIILLHVVIDDLASVNQLFLNNVEEILDRFERTYMHLQTEFLWFFQNSEWYDFVM